MRKGFDACVSLLPFATSLAQRGYDFVGRYYNKNDQSKNLTAAEAQALSNAGLRIVAIWENGFPIAAGYFSYHAGLTDGKNAYEYAALKIQQPESTTIYFAVDYDATTDDINGNILQYFQGIEDAFNAISVCNPLYKVGVYGSGLACAMLTQANLATYTWLAQSTGWQDSKTFQTFHIQQQSKIIEYTSFGAVEGDQNLSPDENTGSFILTPS